MSLAGGWSSGKPGRSTSRTSRGRVVAVVVAISLLVFAGIALAGTIIARRAAERDAVSDALQVADLMSHAVVEPALEDGLLAADAEVRAAAVGRLDRVVRARMLVGALARVKIRAPDGRIVYSDEPRLIGQVFALDDGRRAVLTDSTVRAVVSEPARPENQYERDAAPLLEVYRPVRTPGAQILLLEIYSRYDAVTARSAHLWHGFAGITTSSMLLLLLAQAPLTWALVRRVRRAQQRRLDLLDRAVAATDAERRRIAATLHDGPVQALDAASVTVAEAAGRARSRGDVPEAERLDAAARAVRVGVGNLRSLVVEIYPLSLYSAGLVAGLSDLVKPLRSRGFDVLLELPETLELPAEVETVVFRVAQECLRNIARHSGARHVWVRVRLDQGDEGRAERDLWGGRVLLEISDDGIGFDAAAVIASSAASAASAEGHFGMRLMADVAADAGAALDVLSVSGAGTRWRLEVPLR